MAVTGVFNADFASFYTAVDKADTQLQQLTTTTARAANGAGSFTQQYQKIDGVLASMGVNVSPFVRGLDDIAAAGKKGADGLGLLGTAGAIAGAAMLGWEIGKWIDKMTGASKVVESLTNAVTGWGQALKDQTAGAQQDTINLALSKGAEAGISYANAIKYLQDVMGREIAQKKDWTAVLADAHREVRNLTDAQREDIKIMQEAGAKTEDITKKYGLSAVSLKLLGEREDLVAAQRKAASKVTEERAAAEAKLNEQYAKLMSDVKNANQLAIMEADAAAMAEKKHKAAQGWFDQMQKNIKATNEANAAEQQRIETNQAEIDSLLDVAAAHTEAADAATVGAAQTVQGYQQVQQQITLTGEAMQGWLDLMKYTAQANVILGENSLFTSRSQQERVAAIGSGSLLDPNLGLRPTVGSNVTTNNTFNMTDTASGLARQVSEIIMRQIRAGTQLGQA